MIQVLINSIDRTSLIQVGLTIEDQINQATDTASFAVDTFAGQTFKPIVNDVVEIYVDAVKRYGGVIIEVESTRDRTGKVTHAVQCKDFTTYLDRLLVTERYEDTTLQAVVVDLIDRYADDYGFTDTNVQGASINVKSVSFSEIKLSDCFNKLARLTNFVWYVDADKDVHFLKKNDEAAPFNITDDSENYVYESLRLNDDFSQIRNSVKVRGGEARAAERTELLTGDGEKDTFPLGNKFAETPTVEVDGSPVTVGIDFLQLDEDYDCMWNFQQKYLRFTAGNIPGAPLSGETNIDVTGVPLKPIVVQRPHSVSVAEHGLFEHSIRNDSIKSRDEALQYAQAELESYAASIFGSYFETYQGGLKSGQTIRINSAVFGVNEDFVIQAVRFEMVSPTLYLYRVELATIKTISVIDFLQQLLTKDRLELGEDETLLNFFTYTDGFSFSDELGAISSTTSEDYVVEQNDPGSDSYANVALINKSTVSA
jgi:hypothetical protein